MKQIVAPDTFKYTSKFIHLKDASHFKYMELWFVLWQEDIFLLSYELWLWMHNKYSTNINQTLIGDQIRSRWPETYEQDVWTCNYHEGSIYRAYWVKAGWTFPTDQWNSTLLKSERRVELSLIIMKGTAQRLNWPYNLVLWIQGWTAELAASAYEIIDQVSILSSVNSPTNENLLVLGITKSPGGMQWNNFTNRCTDYRLAGCC